MFNNQTIAEIGASGTIGATMNGIDGATTNIIITIVLRALFSIFELIRKRKEDKKNG